MGNNKKERFKWYICVRNVFIFMLKFFIIGGVFYIIFNSSVVIYENFDKIKKQQINIRDLIDEFYDNVKIFLNTIYTYPMFLMISIVFMVLYSIRYYDSTELF